MAIIESPEPVADSEGIGVPAAIELLLGVMVAELGVLVAKLCMGELVTELRVLVAKLGVLVAKLGLLLVGKLGDIAGASHKLVSIGISE